MVMTRLGGMRRWIGTVALAAAVLSIGPGCAYLDAKQRELIFRPAKEEASWGLRSEAVQEMWLPVRKATATDGSDGSGADLPDAASKIHAWWLPADDPDAPTLLYLHGARWNLTGNAFRIARLRKMGFNVFAIDYRGFGQSSGVLPSEADAYEDAMIAWQYVKSRERDPKKRFVFGHSLGGAVAIELATRSPDMAGLILESTFTNMRDMVSHMWSPMRYLPVGWVLTQHFDSISKISKISVPLLFVHGSADRWVPPTMSEALYQAAAAPKRLLLIEDGSHSNVSAVGFDAYHAAVREFLLARGTASP